MATTNKTPHAAARSLKDQLKSKGRRRRVDLARLAEASVPVRLRNDLLPSLELVHLSSAELRMPERNVRASDPAHLRGVADSIAALGFCAPILVGKDNLVIDGLVRVMAAKIHGMECLPCIRIDHLSGAEQRLLRLALNRLGEAGGWELDQLKIEFEELILADVPVEIAGFAPNEIDHILLDDEAEAVEKHPLRPDVGTVAVTGIGDTYQLGPHRIICGDSTDSDVIRRLLGADEVARLVLTDEPYNVPIGGHVSQGEHREFVMGSGEMTEAQFAAFNLAWIEAVLPFLNDGGILGTFIDWRGYATVSNAASKLGLLALNLIVWTKTNAGMGSLYRSQHELLPLFKKGEAPHLNNVMLGSKGRWRSNVWTYPGASSLGSDARRGLDHHPTVKPVAMLEDALLDLTGRGDIVLDPFLGSGSTLIAAEKTGRTCRGVELDPLYMDLIIRRYQQATGNAAILIDTGETFEDVAVRRVSFAASEYQKETS